MCPPQGHTVLCFKTCTTNISNYRRSTLFTWTSQDSTGPVAVTSPRVKATYSPPGSWANLRQKHENTQTLQKVGGKQERGRRLLTVVLTLGLLRRSREQKNMFARVGGFVSCLAAFVFYCALVVDHRPCARKAKKGGRTSMQENMPLRPRIMKGTKT